ncbi:MAG: tetratricopeptide repeat protein, partial [Armatimonadetes bacterium]|nr:tetratricopeptide repeat protein [Armatimonadota bacterium]
LAEASFALEQWGEAATAYRSLLTRHPKDSAVPRARLRLGEALLHQGKPAEAETVYRELLKAQPSAADALLARYNLALALHQQGQKDEAATLFAEVARLDPRGETGASALLEVGRHAMDQQRYAEARTAYQDFLRRAPQAAEAAQAWWGVGEASYGLKDWPRASDAYQTLIDKFPRHALVERAYYRLIEVYRAQGQGEQADKLAATLRQRFPGSDLSAATLLTTGREAFKAKRYAAASEAFESFLKSYPEHADAGVATANLAASLYLAEELPDHWRRAAEAYAQLARKYPTVSDDALFWAGSAWLEAGQPEPASEALRAFLKAQTAHRYGPRGRLLLGKSLVAQKHHAEACSLLEEVVSAAKDDPALRSEARYELAWALLADGKEDAAYRVFEAIVNDDPRGPLGADARFRLASRAYQKKEYDQAIAGYQEWLQLYPQHALRPKVVYNLAFAQEAKSQYGPAAESYEEAARLLTGGDEDLRQQAAYRRGLMLHRAGNPAGALAAFEVFDTTWPQSKLRVEVAYYRGQALAAQEKWDEAATVFRRLTETAASHALAPSARLNLAVALQNQQKYEEARVLYQSLVNMTGLSPAEQTEALLHLGETLYAQRHHAEALDAFLRVERGPVTALRAPARYWAALCYQHQGETAKAREKLHLVINESPDTDWAKKAKQALAELGT